MNSTAKKSKGAKTKAEKANIYAKIMLVLFAFALAMTPIFVSSIDWNGEEDNLGEWMTTAYSQANNALCVAQDPDANCNEWCDFNASTGRHEPSGRLCCVYTEGVCQASNILP